MLRPSSRRTIGSWTASREITACVRLTGHLTNRHEGCMKLTLNLNGKATDVEVDDPGTPLLYALRDGLGLRGPRFGCGLAQCGACTVLLNGQATRSCVYPSSSVGNAS